MMHQLKWRRPLPDRRAEMDGPTQRRKAANFENGPSSQPSMPKLQPGEQNETQASDWEQKRYRRQRKAVCANVFQRDCGERPAKGVPGQRKDKKQRCAVCPFDQDWPPFPEPVSHRLVAPGTPQIEDVAPGCQPEAVEQQRKWQAPDSCFPIQRTVENGALGVAGIYPDVDQGLPLLRIL